MWYLAKDFAAIAIIPKYTRIFPNNIEWYFCSGLVVPTGQGDSLHRGVWYCKTGEK